MTVGAVVLILAVVAFLWRSGGREETSGTPGGEAVVTDEAAGRIFQTCTDCHQDLDRVARESTVLVYTHEEHFATGVADCTVCHPQETHLPDETRKPTMEGCFVCHGMSDTAIAPGNCTTCHPPGMKGKPPSHDSAGWVVGEHAEQALEDQALCLMCHNTEAFCSSCHGIEMPHPLSWPQVPHALAFFDDGVSLCEGCHEPAAEGRSFCDSCHHPEGPKDVEWRTYHPNAIGDETTPTCFECHSVRTCEACHVRGVESFEADEARYRSAVP